MRRPLLLVLIALLLSTAVPLTGAQESTPTPDPTAICPEPADAATPAPTLDAKTAAANQTALDAIAALPLDRLPAAVNRGEGAERGVLTITLPTALAGLEASAVVTSGAAGQIGTVSRSDTHLIFSFDDITYDVSPIQLPFNRRIAPQAIRLDSDLPNVLCVDLATGEIRRSFHWLLEATNVEYDGDPILSLGDEGRASIAEVIELDADRFSIQLLTAWQSDIDLDTWSIDGITLPSGAISAAADFDGVYILDFSG